MNGFIFLSIYLLVPFLTAYLYKKSNRKIPIIFTYLLVGVLIFVYPFCIFLIDDWLNPISPEHPGNSGPWQIIFLVGNCIVMIPVTQLFLFLFHLLFKKKKASNTVK